MAESSRQNFLVTGILAISCSLLVSLTAVGLGERSASRELEMLLWDMAQEQYLDESSRLAEAVQRELNVLTGTTDRGVKQANFLVLRGATMPAVLVEVGFLSSPREERKMWSPEFQEDTAEALGLFRQAIEIDPGYALAYSGMADVYGQKAIRSWGDREESLRLGIEAAEWEAIRRRAHQEVVDRGQRARRPLRRAPSVDAHARE